MALVKQHPNLVLGPNMPDRGVVADIDWLRREHSARRSSRSFRRANTNRPDAQAFWGIQARNLAKMNAAGVRIVVGTDGNTPYAPHVEMEDMVAAGMTPMQVIVAATRNGAQFLQDDRRRARSRRTRAPTSSCSTRTRSTTSPTRGRSRPLPARRLGGPLLVQIEGWPRPQPEEVQRPTAGAVTARHFSSSAQPFS